MVVNNDAPTATTFSGPNGNESTSMVKVTMTGHPDGLYTKLHFGPSAYKNGLTLATEDCISTCVGTDRKRWTWTEWTQDNPAAAYITNPRPIQTRVGDGTNTKKTTIGYFSSGGLIPYYLPQTIEVYNAAMTAVVKKSVTTYNTSSTYTSRRLIALPTQVETWGWNDSTSILEPATKVTHGYDEENFSFESNQNISSVIFHDNTKLFIELLSGTRQSDIGYAS